MQTKFDELLDFPCAFPFKVLGVAHETLQDRVVEVLQRHAPGDYTPTLRPSSKGTYLSVTVTCTVTSKEHVELLYTELAKIDGVRGVL